ncbi:Hsp20/alpha crystallin family protein [Pedobacter sp. HDW13]|uniref:Hsp20/alpha crystallin family protein n=1 Tax=unclassified Pedobacter TaxID=2628915 RepID=UPI000F59AB94|nr:MULTISPECIES: Hsp20/alpha crystallin family protein [unclassified Pedobacter]QIL39598.1 Hsp20/alpha crystallin family protein [Pedobacter sp. HDW13]RQO78516.1 heat-shock protein Hsp20 [Pedobacter sp. KBW01]
MYNEHSCHTGKMHHGCGHRGGRFGHHFGGRFKPGYEMFNRGFRRVPVNIEETENSFIIHLFAPALVKENLKVVTKDDVLTISYQPAEDGPTEKFSRREYSNGAFERAFALNGKVLNEQISAAYADGILKVTLPKNPETNTPEKDILVD